MYDIELQNSQLTSEFLELLEYFPEISEIEGSPLATLKPPPEFDSEE